MIAHQHPFRFFTQLHEAGLTAVRRAAEAAECGNETSSERFRHASEEIIGCLRACLETDDCDMARIYEFALSQIRSGEVQGLRSASHVLGAVQEAWAGLAGGAAPRLQAA